MKLTIYPEARCDLCGEIVLSRFDCPVCRGNRIVTDMYAEFYQEDKQPVAFSCENCQSRFRAVKNLRDEDGYRVPLDDWEWEIVGPDQKRMTPALYDDIYFTARVIMDDEKDEY